MEVSQDASFVCIHHVASFERYASTQVATGWHRYRVSGVKLCRDVEAVKVTLTKQ